MVNYGDARNGTKGLQRPWSSTRVRAGFGQFSPLASKPVTEPRRAQSGLT
jgi:hypothetical protein